MILQVVAFLGQKNIFWLAGHSIWLFSVLDIEDKLMQRLILGQYIMFQPRKVKKYGKVASWYCLYNKNICWKNERWWQLWQICGLANLAPLGAAGYELTETHTQTEMSSSQISELLPRLKIPLITFIITAPSMHSRLVLLPDEPLGDVLLAVHDDTAAKFFVWFCLL